MSWTVNGSLLNELKGGPNLKLGPYSDIIAKVSQAESNSNKSVEQVKWCSMDIFIEPVRTGLDNSIWISTIASGPPDSAIASSNLSHRRCRSLCLRQESKVDLSLSISLPRSNSLLRRYLPFLFFSFFPFFLFPVLIRNKSYSLLYLRSKSCESI
jgi:hypothetical protein